MAKKFGKFLLFSGAVAAVAAGAYYYLQKNQMCEDEDFEDEDLDYDDFSEDFEEDTERNYVSLGKENQGTETSTASEIEKEPDLKTEEVEEFFDDEDEQN